MKKLWVLFFIVFFTFHEKTASPVTKIQSETTGEHQSYSASINQAVEKRSTLAKLDVPALRQLPELYNGCEVTSLAMLLQASGSSVDKLTLAKQIKKDLTPFKGSSLKGVFGIIMTSVLSAKYFKKLCR